MPGLRVVLAVDTDSLSDVVDATVPEVTGDVRMFSGVGKLSCEMVFTSSPALAEPATFWAAAEGPGLVFAAPAFEVGRLDGSDFGVVERPLEVNEVFGAMGVVFADCSTFSLPMHSVEHGQIEIVSRDEMASVKPATFRTINSPRIMMTRMTKKGQP